RGDALTAGDVGYRYLLRALSDHGRSDVIYSMNHQSEKPGYGFQLARGATSLTEAWDANRNSSQNHFMLGQIVEWLYRDLAGIGIESSAAGFDRVSIDPRPVDGLTWVEATHESPRGPIQVRWERVGDRFFLNVEIPPNAQARVRVPARPGTEVSEEGSSADDPTGAHLLERSAEGAVFTIGSGRYRFEATW
ncbi:MAG TPA: alpha-L-rhamnosidase C-terminal domain-containing protein, partial [Candidatus Synoicihabitans sp.]|nr:alpha-L-rhamnosidase C-terminal domain-containing protein [Candidatus Synoicihabitans sp.]